MYPTVLCHRLMIRLGTTSKRNQNLPYSHSHFEKVIPKSGSVIFVLLTFIIEIVEKFFKNSFSCKIVSPI